MDTATAKEFLISRVVQEAESSHVQLSDIERKMLYFTESPPSLPDILEVNAEFERNYDVDEYEDKIAQLLKNARSHDGQISPNGEDEWKAALGAMRKEDHYILVMCSQAFGPSYGRKRGSEHRVRDFLIYVAVGVGLVLFLLLASWSRH
jgi:hypothetical protein